MISQDGNFTQAVTVLRAPRKSYRAPQRARIYVQEWLNDEGITRRELADRMNTSEPNVTRWLNEPWRITLDVLSGMALALDMPIEDLLRPPAVVKAERRRAERINELRHLLDEVRDRGEEPPNGRRGNH